MRNKKFLFVKRVSYNRIRQSPHLRGISLSRSEKAFYLAVFVFGANVALQSFGHVCRRIFCNICKLNSIFEKDEQYVLFTSISCFSLVKLAFC